MTHNIKHLSNLTVFMSVIFSNHICSQPHNTRGRGYMFSSPSQIVQAFSGPRGRTLLSQLYCSSQRRWKNIFALIVYGKMYPRGSYCRATALYTVRIIRVPFSAGHCSLPRWLGFRCQLIPRTDSVGSASACKYQSSRLSDLASSYHGRITLQVLLPHWPVEIF